MKTKNRTRTRVFIIGALAVMFSFIVAMAAAPSATELKVNDAINKDFSQMTFHKNDIAFHKQQLKDSKKNNDREGKIEARKDLCKARADLRRDKAYLRADKNALVQLREKEMSATAAEKRQNKKELCAAKRQLKKDMRQGNTSNLVDDANLVAAKQKAYNRYEAKLNRQEEALDNKLTAIDNKLDKLNNPDTGQTKLAWNATASTEKGYLGPLEPEHTANTKLSTVLEK